MKETVQISSLSLLDMKETVQISSLSILDVKESLVNFSHPHVCFEGGSGQYRVESVTSSPETRPASSSGQSQSTLVQYCQYTCTVHRVHLYSTQNRFLLQWSRGWQGQALALPAQCSLPSNLSGHLQILHHRWLQVSHRQYTCTLE